MKVAARNSPLSRAQVIEIQYELGLDLEPVFVETHGDQDLVQSLRGLDKTDFFTREVDALVLDGTARISIHAAKDLPDPLPDGLKCIYISKGVDSRDVLVLGDGKALDQVKVVGSSSDRRDAMVRRLKSDIVFKDIRGTIERRLGQLDNGEFDAVVMAEAALIRLKLTHRKRLFLEGDTASLQGKLAILARSDDQIDLVKKIQTVHL